ncbi:MAG TPA: roadblock/LC7 domain-containing protein [Candidatus Deferrimicrobium sp.]|nr:roadblock/LC7 domain-containing protein [Candidatus Deferrimicrobium sp.]
MYELLSELNKTSGITGSMVVGNDGIVIASDLAAELESDAVGALAASITTNIQKSLDRLQTRPLRQVTIEAEDGKLFFAHANVGLLVVTTERDVNIGLVRLEIRNAVSRLNTGI